ncbi:ras-related protein Rab-34-like isoform X2 [Syngnathoides biaculeatus]|uniref:ras-related protein Rab-34-like isoform X2 n=1 Tax=Syngnathoides biaculeatus TaxID=300417 RepID=UPI002ADD49CA|nr:ras-related protein Rab-34-like isoform X2 [Syngnathoides biaculeatus]
MYLTLSGNGSRAARTEGATSILTRARTWIQSDIMLLPTEGDRIITRLPKCFSPKASLRTDELFHPRVQAACRTRTEDAVSFNVAKVIVVGDVSVGKTSLVSRFCRGAFDKNYKATIGVDFDMERFHVLGVPFSLQLWDTAGQERFKCIASTYYRGAQGEGVGLVRVQTKLLRRAFLFCFCSHHCGLRPEQRELLSPRQWLEDAMRENDPSSVLLFLVGTKKDLSSPEQLAQVEEEAVRTSEELGAEYWAVSAKSGDGVRDFFLRVASLTFEANVLSELEKQNGNTTDVISESPSLLHRAVWRPGMSTFATCVHFSQQ